MYPWLTDIQSQLIRLLKNGRLHHATLLQGEKGIGADVLANELAKSILCLGDKAPCNECKSCLLVDADSHPDLHIIQTEKTQIGVDLIRSGIEKVNKTAQLSGNKVVLINHIDRMTESASNAFLKTLEEPTQDTYMVMSSSAANRILPTILSRCEKHQLRMPSVKQSIEYIEAKGLPIPDETTLKAYQNSPLSYIQGLDDEGFNFTDFNQDWRHFIHSKTETSYELSEKWKEKAEDVVNWLFTIISAQITDMLATNNQGIISLLDWQQTELNNAKRKVQQVGVNKSVVLGHLFSSFRQHQNQSLE